MSEPTVEPRPRQIITQPGQKLTPAEIAEIAQRELMPGEKEILWQDQLNRTLTESELDFIFDTARGWIGGRRKINELARFMDITPTRLKSILKR